MLQESIKLTDQVCLVTGGGRGIGRAIALALAKAGAKVAVLARSQDELEETVALIGSMGGLAKAFSADITDAEKISDTIEKVEQSLGPIALLVNNAGAVGPIGPFWESDPDAWWRGVEVNLRGAVLCARFVLPRMVSRRHGRIINISSGGANAAIAYFSSYVTAKTALTRFTECLAVESQPFGIAVFALSPGTVRTSMSEYSLNSREGRRWFPWFRRIFDEGFDLPPERPADLVLILASGVADALSGRFLQPSDDFDYLLKNLDEIERDKLYSLRSHPLSVTANSSAASVAAIRTASESATGIPLRVERTVNAGREEVFGAWIDPGAVAKWFLPPEDAYWLHAPKIDYRPGGHFNLLLNSTGKVFHLYGTYRETKGPERISFTWCWDKDSPVPDGPGETLVNVEFKEEHDQTKIVLTQDHLPSEAAYDAHKRGWERCLHGIEKLFQSS
ncbi:MAG TPA: SDR family NAD(P)-dependent oxidoreductase [Pyrinomonadaceae bacterium]|nr:SDR family NAD(P)-dependent oxidoreductase [Pyrinomonadaceae bacterium]